MMFHMISNNLCGKVTSPIIVVVGTFTAATVASTAGPVPTPFLRSIRAKIMVL